MKVGELPLRQLAKLAARDGLCFRAGPFRVELRTRLPDLLETFRLLYAHAELEEGGIRDFHVEVTGGEGFRRWWRAQALFKLDGQVPFEPYPRGHAFPLMEWGLNYSMALRAHQFCLLHSAVVEKQGRALVMPAMPGSGKSTLCAALMQRGWRLLSDEFGIVEPATGQLLPVPRVIPLKNASIEVIRRFAPEAVIGPLFAGTRKGDVAHLAPTPVSFQLQDQGAIPSWILFPRYQAGADTDLQPVSGSQAFLRLSNNSFNYHLLGETAYRALTTMVQGCQCYRFFYSDLESAVATLDGLVP